MEPARALILDASALYGYVDRRDPRYATVRAMLKGWVGELVVSAYTAAEADYLILNRLGLDAELAFLADLVDVYTVQALDDRGLAQVRELCAKYGDLRLGLADASIVVLADRWRTRSLATFDERHFRAVAPLAGGAFELLPTDSPA
ncbi:MAG: PIN domain-containing protein [Solirubrobacteraceae bacterium]